MRTLPFTCPFIWKVWVCDQEYYIVCRRFQPKWCPVGFDHWLRSPRFGWKSKRTEDVSRQGYHQGSPNVRPFKNEGRNRWVDDGGGERSDQTKHIHTPEHQRGTWKSGPPSKKKEDSSWKSSLYMRFHVSFRECTLSCVLLGCQLQRWLHNLSVGRKRSWVPNVTVPLFRCKLKRPSYAFIWNLHHLQSKVLEKNLIPNRTEDYFKLFLCQFIKLVMSDFPTQIAGRPKRSCWKMPGSQKLPVYLNLCWGQ